MLCTTSPCFFEHHIVDMSTSHIIEVSEKRVPFSKLQPVALAQPSELRMVGERCSALASLHLPTPTGPVTITPNLHLPPTTTTNQCWLCQTDLVFDVVLGTPRESKAQVAKLILKRGAITVVLHKHI